MRIRRFLAFVSVLIAVLAVPSASQAQDSKWNLDLQVGISPSINGNVNSGALGTLQGQAAAILPQSYGDVYGTGLDFRFGGGWMWKPETEVRAMFILQSADANLVRLGDLGPSSLYGQYSDYKTFGLDVGLRQYAPLDTAKFKAYGEFTIGIATIDRIDLELAAPQSNVVFNNTDFYDGTAAFTWSINAGILFPIATKVDINAQMGLRRVSGLAEVDQFVGTDFDDITNDSARVTFPIVVGVRFRF